MGEGATGGGEDPMEMGEGTIGGGGGDLQDHMIVFLQTRLIAAKAQLEDRDAEITSRDVQLFSRESELTLVRRERDDAVERVIQLQDRVWVLEGAQAQGPTEVVLSAMQRAGGEIDY